MKFAKDNKVVTEGIDIVTKSVVKYMLRTGLTLCTAESCTGGMIAQSITQITGASKMFSGGVCTYSEKMKMKILGVSEKTLEEFSVYSPQTACEMAKGARRLFEADCCTAVTGVAGPGPDLGRPAGTVYICALNSQRQISRTFKFYEEYEDLTRENIRTLTTLKALEMVLEVYGQAKDEVNVNG